jgi:hypothetical protein
MKDSARGLFAVRWFAGSLVRSFAVRGSPVPAASKADLGPRRVTLAPHATCLGPGGRDAPATEVGRRQALAGASPAAALDPAFAFATRRTVLRRPCRGAWFETGHRVAERRQPASGELLHVAATRAPHPDSDGELRGLFYLHRNRFNDLLAAGDGQSEEAAALFTISIGRDSMDCAIQSERSFHVLFDDTRESATRATSPYREASAGWTFTSGDVETFPFVQGTSSTRIHRRRSSRIRRAASHGGINSEQPDGYRVTIPVILVNQATERMERRTGRWVSRCVLSGPRRISCTGDRTPREIWGREICDIADGTCRTLPRLSSLRPGPLFRWC